MTQCGKWCARKMIGRTFFITERGYIGFGRHLTLPGDEVAVFLGSDSAMVVRPTSDGRFVLVRDVFCHGFMYGEATLGPLPFNLGPLLSNSHVIEKVDESGGIFTWYADLESGVFCVEDPRLSNVALPADWRRSGVVPDGSGPLRYIRDATNETWNARLRDPKLTAAELRKRRVDLKTFILG
jgi:hypothetical protein